MNTIQETLLNAMEEGLNVANIALVQQSIADNEPVVAEEESVVAEEDVHNQNNLVSVEGVIPVEVQVLESVQADPEQTKPVQPQHNWSKKEKKEKVKKDKVSSKESKEEKNEQDEEEISYKDKPVIKTYKTLTNTFDNNCKKPFMSMYSAEPIEGSFEIFGSELNSHPYGFYKAVYKFSSDMDGMPEYAAGNRNRGFLEQINDHRKYLFNVFRCVPTNENNKTYLFESLWIANLANIDETSSKTMDELIRELIGTSLYDDFEWTKIDTLTESNFIDEFRKKDVPFESYELYFL